MKATDTPRSQNPGPNPNRGGIQASGRQVSPGAGQDLTGRLGGHTVRPLSATPCRSGRVASTRSSGSSQIDWNTAGIVANLSVGVIAKREIRPAFRSHGEAVLFMERSVPGHAHPSVEGVTPGPCRTLLIDHYLPRYLK